MYTKTDQKSRIIFHIDMNSYFASCEQQANPFLRGKPIGVCEHLGGIIIAPSREAKKLGIKTGTPVWEAQKIYPKIQLFYTDPDKYRDITRKFLKIFYEYTDLVEKYSIDEAFLDMTANFQRAKDHWLAAEQAAKEIKEKMRKQLGDWLTCSVGIGDCKLVAKIASDMQKPDGLVIVRPEDRESLYDKLKLTDIPGIGNRMERNLNMLGIKTLRDLRDYPESKLIAHFGIMGEHLHNMGTLQGSWGEAFAEPGEETAEDMKSIGHAYTLPKRTSDAKIATSVLYKLSEMVGRRLRANGLMGNVIHFIISDKDGEYHHRRKKIGYYLYDGREIFLEASKIFEDSEHYKNKKLFRLVGVTVSGLTPYVPQQSLFPKDRVKGDLVKNLDKINDKYGEFTITRIPAWEARDIIRDSVGFGRMKEFKVNFKRAK